MGVPSGWLEDDEGGAVLDPVAFVEGRAHVRLLGGSRDEGVYKGYGLSIVVEVLCGLLTGAAVGPAGVLDAGDGDGDGIGHFFLAIGPSVFGAADFTPRAERMFGALTRSGTDGEGLLSYPGALEHARRAEACSTGVAMSEAVYGDLWLPPRIGCPGAQGFARTGGVGGSDQCDSA